MMEVVALAALPPIVKGGGKLEDEDMLLLLLLNRCRLAVGDQTAPDANE